MMLVVKWRFGWCLSPRRRHLKTPQKRKSRVETFLHYCDLVLSSTVNSVDSINCLTLIVNQHRSRWNLVTSVFVLLRLRHIRATLKPSSSISSWRQATKIPTPAHNLVFKQLGFKFSFSFSTMVSSLPNWHFSTIFSNWPFLRTRKNKRRQLDNQQIGLGLVT